MSKLKPKVRLKKLNIIQEEAVQALKDNSYNGTVNTFIGSGKSFIILKTLISALKDNILKEGDEIWIMAEEVKARKYTFFEEEIPKFKDLYNYDILELFNVKFYSYNIGPKYTQQIIKGERNPPKFIGMDEVDACISKEYWKTLLLIDLGVYICGYTATKASTLNVFRDKIDNTFINTVRQSDKQTKDRKVTKLINKGQLLNIYLPTVYEKSFNWAIEEGLLSSFKTIVIKHNLSSKTKTQITKFKKGSEKEYWEYWDKIIQDDSKPSGWRFGQIKGRQLPKFLMTLKSKIFVVRKLISLYPNKKILVFGATLNFLRNITDNVAEEHFIINGERYNTLQEYKKEKGIKHNSALKEGEYATLEKITINKFLDNFNNGAKNVIASSKRLRRGVTLKGLDMQVICLQGKSNTTLTQQLRLSRYEKNKEGLLFIIVTEDTFEENWLKRIVEIKDYKGKVIDKINLNIIKTINSKSLWK